MPQIHQYTNQATISPDSRATIAYDRAARRGAALYNTVAQNYRQMGQEVGSAVRGIGEIGYRYLEHRDISRGAATEAEVYEALNNEWNNTVKNADPNDPTVAAKFNEKVLNPRLEKFTEGYLTEGGRKWSESRVQAIRNHFRTKTTSDMMTLAANAVAVNADRMSNSLSNVAVTDPSALPHLLSTVDANVNSLVASSPNLSGVKASALRTTIAQNMKEHIVKAAAVGAIKASPNPEATAVALGKKYPNYLNGADLKSLASAARTEMRARRLDAAFAKKLKTDAAVDASFDRWREHYLPRILRLDPKAAPPNPKMIQKELLNDAQIYKKHVDHMIGVIERELKPETPTVHSAQTATQLFDRIMAPPGDPRRVTDLDEINKARSSGDLNNPDYRFLTDAFNSQRDPAGNKFWPKAIQIIQGATPQIDHSNPAMGKAGLDPIGSLRAKEYRLWAFSTITRAIQNNEDPNEYLNSKSPKYIARPDVIRDFQTPLDESLRRISDSINRQANNVSRNAAGPKTVTTVPVQEAPIARPPAAPPLIPPGHPNAYIDPRDNKVYERIGGKLYRLEWK